MRGLASGETEWEGPVKRRARPTEDFHWQYDVGKETHMGETRISRPHNITRRFMQRLWGRVLAQCPRMEVKGTERERVEGKGQQECEVENGQVEEEQVDKGEKLRRTEVMDKVAGELGKWKVYWADVQKRRDIAFTPKQALQNSLFRGVDKQGKRIIR